MVERTKKKNRCIQIILYFTGGRDTFYYTEKRMGILPADIDCRQQSGRFQHGDVHGIHAAEEREYRIAWLRRHRILCRWKVWCGGLGCRLQAFCCNVERSFLHYLYHILFCTWQMTSPMIWLIWHVEYDTIYCLRSFAFIPQNLSSCLLADICFHTKD